MSDSDIVTLNVGGVVYTTTKTTLTKYPDSMLGAMFNGSMKPSNLDKDGHVFIDRDGEMFKFVLEFLRCGQLSFPDDFSEEEKLLTEAQFYGLEQMIAAVEVPALPVPEHISICITKHSGYASAYIRGSNLAISKLPPQYIDTNTYTLLQQKRKEKIFSCKITLSFHDVTYQRYIPPLDLDDWDEYDYDNRQKEYEWSIRDQSAFDISWPGVMIKGFEKKLELYGWKCNGRYLPLFGSDVPNGEIVDNSSWYYKQKNASCTKS